MHGARFAGYVLGMAVWETMVAGTACAEPEVPVEMRWESLHMECEGSRSDGPPRESLPKLVFHLVLKVKEPWCFVGISGVKNQCLNVTDSSGRRLHPATFDLSWLLPYVENGVVSVRVKGTVEELPGPDVSWLRLKGTLRVPVARSRKSPVYELPPEQGANIRIPLPGSGEEDNSGDGDIAGAPDVPMGKLSVTQYEIIPSRGRQVVRMMLSLETPACFDFDNFELVDDRGKILGVSGGGIIPILDDVPRKWSKYVELEKTEELRKLRIRLRYRIPQGTVALPVDLRVGMGGEIRERK